MSKTERSDEPEGLPFITRLILGKLVLIAIVGMVVYFSLQGL